MLMPTINTVLLHYVDVVVVFVIFLADGSMLISDIGMRRDDKTIRFISIKDTRKSKVRTECRWYENNLTLFGFSTGLEALSLPSESSSSSRYVMFLFLGIIIKSTF